MELDIFKKCSRCGEVKHASAFYPSKVGKTKLTSRCKQCDVLYRADNIEKIKERQKKYRERDRARFADLPIEEQREQASLSRQRWLDYREKRRAHLNAKSAAYKKMHREQDNAAKVERRRRVREATPAWAKPSDFEEFRTIALMFRIYTGQSYDVDHIVPLRGKILGELVVCGLHCESNMTVVPAVENKLKSNRRWPDMP